MGYGSRHNGQIVRPTQDRMVALSDVSKAQLAAALNEQSERFKAMRKQLEQATRVLVAITLEPESFRFSDGRRTVDVAALQKVQTGMTLRMDETGDVLVMKVDDVDAPAIDMPRILMPAGVN